MNHDPSSVKHDTSGVNCDASSVNRDASGVNRDATSVKQAPSRSGRRLHLPLFARSATMSSLDDP